MNEHRANRRRFIRAGCFVAAAVLAAAALIGSLVRPGDVLLHRWGVVVAMHPGGGVWVLHATSPTRGSILVIYDVHGMSYIVTHQPDGTSLVQHIRSARRWVVRPVTASSGATMPAARGVLVSLWWFAAVAWMLAGWALRAAWRARARPGACPACGYSTVGLTRGVACPECGSPQRVR